jgi:nucleotide-binding universal stress UspA family protein
MKAVQARTRIALKNILFASDFSAASLAATPFAIQLAKRYRAKVYGVHVNTFENYAIAAPEAIASMAQAAVEESREDARLLNEQLKNVEHEVFVVEGNVWTVISGLIAEKNIDLIVVGTRGRSGFGKAVLGSVAEQIVRQASCPVLTVGPHVSLEPANAVKMHEILFATDLLAEFPAAAPYAVSLAQENQAHLVLLHVMHHPATGDLVHPHDLAGTMQRKLSSLIPEEAELWCEPVCLVEQGEPAAKILDVAKRRRSDLIVLGAHPVSGMLAAATHLNAGTVHKIILQANCPVLTIRG